MQSRTAPARRSLSVGGSPRLTLLIFFLVGFVTYFPTLTNDFIIGDDEDQIISHPLVHDIQKIPRLFTSSTYYVESGSAPWGLFYRPLMLTFFSLLYQLNGPDPLVFHLFSLVLHILNAYLVFLLFSKLVVLLKPKTYPLFPFFLSLVFLVHPINSEAILHAANLQELLVTCFGLLLLHSIISWHSLTGPVKSFSPGQSPANTPRQPTRLNKQSVARRAVWWALQFFFLSIFCLFSKETGLLFLILAVVLYLLLNQPVLQVGPKPARRSSRTANGLLFVNLKSYLLNLFPLIISSISSVAVYFILRSAAKVGLSPPHFGLMYTRTLSERLLNLPAVLFYYLKTLVFPLKLANFQAWFITTPTIQNFYLPLIVLQLLIICFIIWYLKFKYYFKFQISNFKFFLIWLLLFLLPLSHLFPLYTTVAERWFYPAFIGLLGILGIFLRSIRIIRNFPRSWLLAIYYALIAVLALRTHVRALDWRTSQTLLEHDIPLSDKPFYAQNLLATLYIRQGEYAKALPLVEDSIKVFPNTGNLSNRGVIAVHQGDFATAKDYYLKSLEAGRIYGAVINYMNLLVFVDPDYPEAQSFVEENLPVYPKSSELWLGLAVSRYYQEDLDGAKKAARTSYALTPLAITRELLEAISQNRDPNFAPFLSQ